MPILPLNDRRNEANQHCRHPTATLIRRLGLTVAFSLVTLLSLFVFADRKLLSDDLFVFPLRTQALFTSMERTPPIVLANWAPLRFLGDLSNKAIQAENEYKWDTLKAGEHCLRYATREYTARLLTSGSSNPSETMRACKETAVEIHGKTLMTDWCLDLGFGRGVYGFWIVDFEEPACETRWGKFNDLGCEDRITLNDKLSEPTAIRRVESRLENLQPGSNWQIMCVTTPADIYGRHFGSPAACVNDAKAGVYGEWDMRDFDC